VIPIWPLVKIQRPREEGRVRGGAAKQPRWTRAAKVGLLLINLQHKF
jgi:hypothetical protein